MANTDTYEWRLIGTTLTAAATDRILPVINSHFYYVLNEAGSGEATIPLDSIAAGVVTEGMLAVLYYRGAIRGSFLIENIRKVPASSQEGAGEVLSISGRGGMSVLDRAIIWGDGTTSTTRTFTAVTKGSILKTLIDEAIARSGLPSLTYDFSATVDSDAVSWTDSETYKLNVGMTLLELVRQFAETGIDFEVNYSGTGFVLSAYKNGIGTDKSNTVFFRTGANCQEIDIDQRGNDIKNALLVAYKEGSIVITDSASITTNGRREELLDARLAQTAASATTYGSAILDINKDTKIGRTIKVYDGIPPYLFVNYILGDTITLDIEGIETTDRILGIQCDFNGEYSNVIIELNSLMLQQNIRLQQDVDWLLNQWNTARDADLLEVSYWAAIGDPNIELEAGTISGIGRLLSIHKIGSTIYFAETDIGRITSYSIASGRWDVVATVAYPHCMTSIGTDLYIGGYGAWKLDTTTNTLTSIGTVYPSASPVGRIFAAAIIGTDVYFGGKFDNVSTTTYGNFVRYNTTAGTWHDCGTGVAGTVLCLLAVGSNVYIGGSITAINGVAVTRVGYWNGTTGVAMSTGLDNTVHTLVAYGSNVLAGGLFTNSISEWTGSTWAVFGGGITGGVYGIAVYLTDVYAVGDFTVYGNYIARYSGGAWWELGTGLNNYASDIVLNDNDVYVIGTFTTAGGKIVRYVAAYFNNFESLTDYLENASSSFNMAAAIHAAAASTISDSDEMGFWEDVTNALRKITWANIKATLKTYFDTLYFAITQTANRIPFANASGNTVVGDALEYADADKLISLGKSGGNNANMIFSFDSVTVTFFNLSTWGAGLYSSIRGIFARGTKASPTAVLADDVLMRFRGSGYDGTTAVLSSATNAEMKVVANENQSSTAHGGRLEFWTTPNGSTTETKSLTVGADGNINIESGKTYNINGSPHTHGDGWTKVSDTWTYASASTITIPSDGTLIYSKGMKLKWKQGDAFYRYGNVLSVTSTVITIVVNTTDSAGNTSVVSNVTITESYYSTAAAPFGFPKFFNYAPSPIVTGDTTNPAPTINYARYNMLSNGQYYLQVFATWTATVGSGVYRLVLPITGDTGAAWLLTGMIYDTSEAAYYLCTAIDDSAGKIVLISSSGSIIAHNAPFVWATGDQLFISGIVPMG